MPELTIAQVIDKNKIASDRVWLFALKIYLLDANRNVTGTYRLVRNNESVTIDGETYDPFPFEIDRSDSGSELGSLSVTVQDQLGIIQSLMGMHYGLVGYEVDAIVADFDAASTTATTSVAEKYQITTSSCNDYVAQFELGAENPLRLLVPTRVQMRDRCSFRYKSPECGYSGALTSCDFTLNGTNGCVAHSNSARFGGYPSLVIRGD